MQISTRQMPNPRRFVIRIGILFFLVPFSSRPAKANWNTSLPLAIPSWSRRRAEKQDDQSYNRTALSPTGNGKDRDQFARPFILAIRDPLEE
jgi:hypothetical protein